MKGDNGTAFDTEHIRVSLRRRSQPDTRTSDTGMPCVGGSLVFQGGCR